MTSGRLSHENLPEFAPQDTPDRDEPNPRQAGALEGKKVTAWVLLVFVAAAFLSGYRACAPGGDGVVASLILEDGSEYRITQEWDSWEEPYSVDFWFRPSGGEWGWCYVDCDDSRWRAAQLEYSEERGSVRVLDGGELRAELFLGNSTFTLYGGSERTLPAPQELRPPPF